jgi:hypothetical protein
VIRDIAAECDSLLELTLGIGLLPLVVGFALLPPYPDQEYDRHEDKQPKTGDGIA